MNGSDVLYENAFVPDEKDIEGFAAHQLKKRTPRTVAATVSVVLFMFALWFWLSSWGIIAAQFLHLLFAVCLMASIMATDTVMKHSEFRRLVKKFSLQNKDDLAGIKTRFYEDGVESNGKMYNYDEFSSVFYSDRCIYLVAANGKVLMVKDDGAAFGKSFGESDEQFWDFLNSKCSIKKQPQEKPKRWYLKFRYYQ